MPVNFKNEDISIFKKAIDYKIAGNSIEKNAYFVLYNFNLFKTYNKIDFFTKNKMQVSTGKIKLLEIVRLKIIFNEYIFFNHWSLNYFHWFTEVLPKIYHVSTAAKKVISVYIPNWLYKVDFICKSLSLLPNIKICICNKTALFLNAKICDLQVSSGNYNDIFIKQLFDSITPKIKKLSDTKYKGIFIYRKPEEKRSVTNYEAFSAVLNKYDILSVDFSRYSWEEQISYVTGTNLLIGIHGAGLTNMLFMKENSNVLELRRKDDGHNNCYFSLATTLKHKYWYQLCDVDDYSIDTQKNNFHIDVFHFEKILVEIFKK
ncbi:glycosyltransferase family 61 protein [Ferruginibacter lapsinanis]|uniref:glycosyltransferase family 61 protein n=1 Tax=Ferruginibacter lapsinanis TaxID=563172 RepID=UPI001E500340|nr:glycosyltransferase family 61 protein [Ferruginibacter lapsinanis]UEG49469.1 glycosyltransferase family 61 protein [Ferruginibacter lapsinanis]